MNMKALAVAATLFLTAACTFNLRPGADDADEPAAESMKRMEIVASLTYRERIALPADAVVHTRFDRIDESGVHRISSYDTSLDGRQVPVPLELGFRHSVGSDALLTMRSRVFLDDILLRDTGPVLLDATRRSADLGELQLFTPAQLGLDSESADLPMPERASGNEPGWMLQIEDDHRARLVRDYGQVEDSLQILQQDRAGDLIQVFARNEDTGIVAAFHSRICRDSATGMPHPWQASVQTLDDGALNGCGGDPLSLLTSAEWRIERVGAEEVPDEISMTLLFDDDSRLSGQSACNRYFADYRLSGEGLEIKQPGATLMACAEQQMELERAFFERLPEIRHFDISADGRLLLKSTDGDVVDIVAAKPKGDA